jgi:sRNA-binding carbon storage regulator CsrA
MPFLTDLAPYERIELKVGESLISLKVIKRTGTKVRLSINAGREVGIKKLDSRKESKNGGHAKTQKNE